MRAITPLKQQIHFLCSDFCTPTSLILPAWRVSQRQGHDVFHFGQAVSGTTDSEPPPGLCCHISTGYQISSELLNVIPNALLACQEQVSRSLTKPPLEQRTERAPEPAGIQLPEIQDAGSISNRRRHRGAKALLPDNHSTCPAQTAAEDTMVCAALFSTGEGRGSQERQPKDKRHDREGGGRVQDSCLGRRGIPCTCHTQRADCFTGASP